MLIVKTLNGKDNKSNRFVSGFGMLEGRKRIENFREENYREVPEP